MLVRGVFLRDQPCPRLKGVGPQHCHFFGEHLIMPTQFDPRTTNFSMLTRGVGECFMWVNHVPSEGGFAPVLPVFFNLLNPVYMCTPFDLESQIQHHNTSREEACFYSWCNSPRLRNDLYCVEWDVKLYYTIPYPLNLSGSGRQWLKFLDLQMPT